MNNFPDTVMDSVGNTYGYYTVIKPFFNKDRGANANRYVTVRCVCGIVKNIRFDSLVSNSSASCGCTRVKTYGSKFQTKTVKEHPLYTVWTDMNRRCYSPSRKDFKHYGGRGIEVCKLWRRETKSGFLNFLLDMEQSFERGLELERLDTNKGYYPDNCTWVDRKSQVNNTRVNHVIKGYGVTLTIEEWNYFLEIEKGLIWDRVVYLGWDSDIEKILLTDFRDRRWHFKYKGGTYNAKELWEELGYSYGKRCSLVNKAGNSVDALLAEGIDFEVIKPREKAVLTFEEGIQKLVSSDKPFDRFLLDKITKKLEEK